MLFFRQCASYSECQWRREVSLPLNFAVAGFAVSR
jgi:hypothetical protein